MSVAENSLKMEDDSEEEKQLRLDDHTEGELNNTERYDAATRSNLSEAHDEDVTTPNNNQMIKPKMDDDAKVLMEFATLFTETTSTGNDFSSPTKQIPVPTSTLLPHTSVLNQPPKPPSTMIIPVPFSSSRASSSEDSSGSLPTNIPLTKIKTPSSTKKTKKDSSPNKPKRQTKSYKEEFLTVDQTEPKKKRGRPPGTKKDAGKKKKDTEDAPSTPQSKKNKLDGFPNSEVTNQQLKVIDPSRYNGFYRSICNRETLDQMFLNRKGDIEFDPPFSTNHLDGCLMKVLQKYDHKNSLIGIVDLSLQSLFISSNK